MKQIKQLFWILFFSFLGELLSYLSPIAIPASVFGMILLFIALHFKWIKLEQVDEAGTWLTNNMSLFFVGAGAGLVTNLDLLADVWWQIIIVVFISTSLMIWFTGLVVQFIIKKSDRHKQREGKG